LTPDIAIVGAGPIGLQAAILAKRAGLTPVVFDQGCIVNAIARYPTYMTFFTTAERLEIGGHPLVTASGKPTRKEALDYYRKVVHNEQLDVRQYTAVEAITPEGQGFRLAVRSGNGVQDSITARIVIVATGYFDTPKQLGIPGEDLPNVSHYYTESHPYYNRNVVIVGAGSSAADAALDLYRAGAKVTMIHRGGDFRHSLKYWIRPDLVNRVREGSITAHMNTTVRCITPAAVQARNESGAELLIPADQTFLLTGYYADPALLRSCGVICDDSTLAAQLDPDTFESNVPGLFVIGSAGTGLRTSDVFIENGLVHADRALERITTLLR
jgi:thioredoxin reductase (NADPH)